MKSKSLVLFVAMMLMVFLSACAPVAGVRAQFVQLPDTLKADITALVVFVVSWLFMKLIELIPALSFLEEFRVPLALAVASQLIGLIQTATPDAYANVVILALQLGLAILALFLGAGQLKARGVKAFR